MLIVFNSPTKGNIKNLKTESKFVDLPMRPCNHHPGNITWERNTYRSFYFYIKQGIQLTNVAINFPFILPSCRTDLEFLKRITTYVKDKGVVKIRKY